jgi:hypothetical protein
MKRTKFTDHMPPRKGLKAVKAVCGCGHKGRSQYPQWYQCTACYNEAWAQHNRELADKLEARVKKLREEAVVRLEKAAAFRAKHGH